MVLNIIHILTTCYINVKWCYKAHKGQHTAYVIHAVISSTEGLTCWNELSLCCVMAASWALSTYLNLQPPPALPDNTIPSPSPPHPAVQSQLHLRSPSNSCSHPHLPHPPRPRFHWGWGSWECANNPPLQFCTHPLGPSMSLWFTAVTR